MADKLESYFKKHLIDDPEDGDDWNIPSDSVWENAIPEIQKKSGIFVPWKYIYWLGLITMVTLLIAFLMWNQNNDLLSINKETEITNKQNNNNTNPLIFSDSLMKKSKSGNEEPANNISSDGDSQYSNANIALINNNDESVKKTESKKEIVNPINEIDSNSDIKDKGGNNKKFTGDKATIAQEVDIQMEVNNVIIDTKDAASEMITKAIVPPALTTSIADSNSTLNPDYKANFQSDIMSDVINNEETNPTLNNKELQIKEDNPISYAGKVGLGLYYAPTLTATYLRGDLVAGIEKTKPVYLYSGNYGIEIKYYFSNRFALVSGIGRSEIRSWSKSSADFNYNLSTQHEMENGDKENTSPVPMSSPFGTVNTEVTYRFPGSDNIPDGEIMHSELETHQDVKYLTIPIGAEFNMIDFSHLSWFAEGGLSFNYATKDATKFSSRIIHYGNDMNVVGEEITGHQTYKDYYFGYYLGIGIKYNISNKIQLNSSLRYNGNVSPVNKQDNMSTNIHAFNLKIGISYFF